MKHLLVTTLLSLAPFCANAIVADSFTCTITAKDQTTGDTDYQNINFQLARMPLSYSPASDVRLTTGATTFSSTFNTQKNEITTNVNMYYSHATKVDAAGQVIDARQYTCLTITSDACSKGTGDDYKICGTSLSNCMTSSKDPFDPVGGWSKVGIISDVPTFKEQSLISLTDVIQDENQKTVGLASFECRFKGTYQ